MLPFGRWPGHLFSMIQRGLEIWGGEMQWHNSIPPMQPAELLEAGYLLSAANSSITVSEADGRLTASFDELRALANITPVAFPVGQVGSRAQRGKARCSAAWRSTAQHSAAVTAASAQRNLAAVVLEEPLFLVPHKKALPLPRNPPRPAPRA